MKKYTEFIIFVTVFVAFAIIGCSDRDMGEFWCNEGDNCLRAAERNLSGDRVYFANRALNNFHKSRDYYLEIDRNTPEDAPEKFMLKNTIKALNIRIMKANSIVSIAPVYLWKDPIP
jgi:hypothetical protein